MATPTQELTMETFFTFLTFLSLEALIVLSGVFILNSLLKVVNTLDALSTKTDLLAKTAQTLVDDLRKAIK
jgi:hypothetical protein